jgi:hypothetical protein
LRSSGPHRDPHPDAVRLVFADRPIDVDLLTRIAAHA